MTTWLTQPSKRKKIISINFINDQCIIDWRCFKEMIFHLYRMTCDVLSLSLIISETFSILMITITDFKTALNIIWSTWQLVIHWSQIVDLQVYE
jgi:hypothetical protein